jgi:hypothetical protein
MPGPSVRRLAAITPQMFFSFTDAFDSLFLSQSPDEAGQFARDSGDGDR